MMTHHTTVTRDEIESALFSVACDLAEGMGYGGLVIAGDDQPQRIPSDLEVTIAAAQPVTVAAVLADVARALGVDLPPAIAAVMNTTVELAPSA